MCLTPSTPGFLSASRKVEIDFTIRLDVYPQATKELGNGQGPSCRPNEMSRRERRGAKRPEYWSRLCGKELKRWDPTMPGTFEH